MALLLWLLTVPAAAWAQGSPIVALAQDSTSGTDDLYYLDLGSGGLTHGDQLRRDPLRMRARGLRQNVFQEIGRPTDQPAMAGEILLAQIRSTSGNARAALFVETSTGYVAYYDQLGKGGAFGKIVTTIGRPFAPLAAADGNFALLTRHSSNGRTEGAYLYHAGSGRGFLLRIANKPSPDAPTAAAAGFPRLTGKVSAAEIQVSDRTTGYLVADAADGSLRFLDLGGASVTERASPVGLFPAFSAESADPSSRRFTAAPIRNGSETTTHVLFVDASSGDLAVVEGVGDPGRQPVVQKLAANLFTVLGTAAGAGWRNVAAVPGVTSSGATGGIWLIDSLTRRAAWVGNLQTPGAATVQRVRVGN